MAPHYTRLDTEIRESEQLSGNTWFTVYKGCASTPTIVRVVLELFGVGLLYLACTLVIQHRGIVPEPSGYTEISKEIRRPPTSIITFAPNESFYGYTDQSTEAWASLMPKGRGFVVVENPARIGLLPGIPITETGDRYPLSAFHQLHCLATLREAHYQLKLGLADKTSEEDHGHHVHQSEAHLDHCWDYLRQVIMCFADPAIEPARIDENGKRKDTDGWKGQHQCRNWEALKNYVTTNRAYDGEGVLGN